MKSMMITFLFLFVCIYNCGYVNGQQESCEQCVDDACSIDECTGYIGCEYDMSEGGDGLCVTIADEEEEEVEDEDVDCDDDDDDASNYRIDYIGKSTQFRLYNPCNNKFIKFKMEDITEYDGDTHKKLNNKETSFASADWSWNNPNGVDVDYEGAKSIYNVYEADQLSNGASFTLETILFREDATINTYDDNGDVVSSTTVNANDLKWNVRLDGWEYENDGNYIVMCLGVMTNNAGDFDTNSDETTYNFPGFEVDNDNFATCTGYDDVNVKVEPTGNNNNQLDLCYTFSSCESGTISYDPIIRIRGQANSFTFYTTISIIISSVIFILL